MKWTADFDVVDEINSTMVLRLSPTQPTDSHHLSSARCNRCMMRLPESFMDGRVFQAMESCPGKL